MDNCEHSLSQFSDFMLNFDKLFDRIRIVDPVSKQVIQDSGTEDSFPLSTCYGFWKNGEYCTNCVSSRAIQANDTFVKIEYNHDRLFMVMASPTKLDGKPLVVEMLKDVTDTGIVADVNGKSAEDIYEIISNLNRQVMTDELTQTYNRRYLNERLPVDLYNTVLNRSEMSVIMLDIDHFKEINDTYGHVCGDVILKQVGTSAGSAVRKKQDWIARYGGDEFIISLPGAGHQVTARIAEDIRRRVQGAPIEHEGQKIPVTISIGTYTIHSENIDAEELLSRADKNLYQAKAEGRNTVIAGRTDKENDPA